MTTRRRTTRLCSAASLSAPPTAKGAAAGATYPAAVSPRLITPVLIATPMTLDIELVQDPYLLRVAEIQNAVIVLTLIIHHMAGNSGVIGKLADFETTHPLMKEEGQVAGHIAMVLLGLGWILVHSEVKSLEETTQMFVQGKETGTVPILHFVPGAPPPPPHDYRPRRDRLSYLEGEYRGRDKYGRLVPQESGQRDRMRGSFFGGRKGYERQPLSPPLHPPPLPAGHDRRGHVMRERSRSPIDGSSKGYQRDLYMDRGRDGRSGGRDRISRTY
ncbi:hypothetical protein CRG98_028298 [Punica granatum]|uniref:Uncharacterized protein n=1 Tax=Punica granatum TaxID=22663 RepID=A0A2I0J6H6_PUNGR|nr:hypothetical protein CRG98_028298 [Punica granatum]